MLKVFRQPDTAVTCQQVDENLEAYLDSALTTTQMSAFQTHINRCSSCQALLQQEQLQIRQLRCEAQLNQRTLSPVESAEIQQNLYRQMRRNIRWKI